MRLRLLLCFNGGLMLLLLVGETSMSSVHAVAPNPPGEKYVYVPLPDQWIGLHRDGWMLIGKLDEAGNFEHDNKYKRGELPEKRKARFYSGRNLYAVRTKVYEFRSGILIPGEIQPDGNFVPELGGKIIAFKEYQYTPEATKIWNLPGIFLTEKEEAARQKLLKSVEQK